MATSAALVVLAASGCGRGDMLGPVAKADSARTTAIRTALVEAGDSGGAGGATVSTGIGWATLRGRFVYDPNAAPPQMPPYNVTSEPTICTNGGRPPLQETLLVDSGTGGIKYIAIYLRNASRVHESAQPTGDSVVFDQKTCKFLTHVLAVKVGQTLDIKNSDPTGHNTNIVNSGIPSTTIPSMGMIPFPVQSHAALPWSVTCNIHPWMRAYILSRENGYFAVTGEDGSFEIANLPAGEELEFQVWHESAAGTNGALVPGTPETQALKWTNRGRFTITLEADVAKDIEAITVPATAFRR